MNIDIIGGGIGGLVTAIALQQKGISYRIFESVKEIKPIGAGIILASNAMQVFRKLGIYDDILSVGHPITNMNITSRQLKILSRANLSYLEKKHNVKSVAIHRGILQERLLEHINFNNIFLGKKLISCSIEKKHNLTLKFEDKSKIKSKYIIGADGINSTVRNSFFSNYKIRETRQVCWRGIAHYILPKNFIHDLNEAWGYGKRFGFVQISKEKVYWYALESFKRDINEYSKGELDKYFNEFHPIIKEIIDITPHKNIYTNKIVDLKPMANWILGNVCLLGDAAHAMTPNIGQGACQAIEDAYILGECLSKYSLKEAFEYYQKLRISKANSLVKASFKVGKVAHIKNYILAQCIYFMLRNMPESIIRKQSEKTFDLIEI